MNLTRSIAIRLLLPILLASFLVDCRGGDSGAIARLIGSPEETGGSVTLTSAAPLPVINPLKNRSWQARSLYYLMYDNLVDVDQNLQFVPRLAKSWEISADLRSITFHLRDDVRWHDNSAFTANDVLYSYQHYRSLPDPSRPGRMLFDGISDVSLITPYTVKVVYERPNALAMADWLIEIVPQPPRQNPTPEGTCSSGEIPLGSGPFRFIGEDTATATLSCLAFDGYWNGRPHFDQIKVRFCTEPQAAELFRQKQVDHLQLSVNGTSRDLLAAIERDSRLYKFDSLTYYFIGWKSDDSNPFFNHRRIRKAMSLSYNRKKALELLFGGRGKVCDVPLPPWGFDSESENLAYSPTVAVDLLREVNCKDIDMDGVRELDGRKFIFTLLYPSGDRIATEIAQAFGDGLRKLGVLMTPLGLPAAELASRLNHGQFDAFLTSGQVELDLSYLRSLLASSDIQKSGNVLGYRDPILDNLFIKFFETSTVKTFPKNLARIRERIVQEQPCTFLFFRPTTVAFNKKIEMIRPCPRGLWEWYPSLLDWFIPREPGTVE